MVLSLKYDDFLELLCKDVVKICLIASFYQQAACIKGLNVREETYLAFNSWLLIGYRVYSLLKIQLIKVA